MSHTSLHSDKLIDLILQKTNCSFQMLSITFYIFRSHSETKQTQLTLNIYKYIYIHTVSGSLLLFAHCVGFILSTPESSVDSPLHLNHSSCPDCITFSSQISLNFAACILPSTSRSLPRSEVEKHHRFMFLPPPCFMVWVVCL